MTRLQLNIKSVALKLIRHGHQISVSKLRKEGITGQWNHINRTIEYLIASGDLPPDCYLSHGPKLKEIYSHPAEQRVSFKKNKAEYIFVPTNEWDRRAEESREMVRQYNKAMKRVKS